MSSTLKSEYKIIIAVGISFLTLIIIAVGSAVIFFTNHNQESSQQPFNSAIIADHQDKFVAVDMDQFDIFFDKQPQEERAVIIEFFRFNCVYCSINEINHSQIRKQYVDAGKLSYGKYHSASAPINDMDLYTQCFYEQNRLHLLQSFIIGRGEVEGMGLRIEDFEEVLDSPKINKTAILECAESEETKNKIVARQIFTDKFRVNQVPAFFVGTIKENKFYGLQFNQNLGVGDYQIFVELISNNPTEFIDYITSSDKIKQQSSYQDWRDYVNSKLAENKLMQSQSMTDKISKEYGYIENDDQFIKVSEIQEGMFLYQDAKSTGPRSNMQDSVVEISDITPRLDTCPELGNFQENILQISNETTFKLLTENGIQTFLQIPTEIDWTKNIGHVSLNQELLEASPNQKKLLAQDQRHYFIYDENHFPELNNCI